MAKDPVCGMEIDEKKAKFSTVKNGKKHYFCSRNCYNKFNEKPASTKKTINKDSIKIKSEKSEDNIQKTTIAISGMHCATCAQTIEKALAKTKGVLKASVNFASEKANVEFDKNVTDGNSLKNIIKKTGYKVIEQHQETGNAAEVKLKVIGMDNPHCVGTVGDALNLLSGVISRELYVNQNAFIRYDQTLTSLEEIKKIIKKAGYEPIEVSG
ncbi:copper ion binding protein, partial [Candidatus Woesearchaeota archaeon]|nr:copper ion binding protein [Candidatus Woesearchaeota archaeon]